MKHGHIKSPGLLRLSDEVCHLHSLVLRGEARGCAYFIRALAKDVFKSSGRCYFARATEYSMDSRNESKVDDGRQLAEGSRHRGCLGRMEGIICKTGNGWSLTLKLPKWNLFDVVFWL